MKAEMTRCPKSSGNTWVFTRRSHTKVRKVRAASRYSRRPGRTKRNTSSPSGAGWPWVGASVIGLVWLQGRGAGPPLSGRNTGTPGGSASRTASTLPRCWRTRLRATHRVLERPGRTGAAQIAAGHPGHARPDHPVRPVAAGRARRAAAGRAGQRHPGAHPPAAVRVRVTLRCALGRDGADGRATYCVGQIGATGYSSERARAWRPWP